MKIAIVTLCLASFCAALAIPSDVQIQNEFRNFQAKYKRVYDGEQETLKRYQIFRNNYILALSENEKYNTTTQGVTKFSDRTRQELSGMFMRSHKPRYTTKIWEDVNTTALPTTFDWRDKGAVTPVQDQGDCGSCWAFSVTGNIEGVSQIKTGKLVKLSEQQLVDCDKTCVMYHGQKVCNSGCDGGFQDAAFNYIIKTGGIDTATSYKYTAREGRCRYNAQTIGAKLVSWKWLSTNEEKLAEELVNLGPVSVAVNADTLLRYTGGIFKGNGCDPEDLNHAVLLTGFGVDSAGRKFWNMKNSWADDWGEDGYARIAFGSNVCGIASEPLTAEV